MAKGLAKLRLLLKERTVRDHISRAVDELRTPLCVSDNDDTRNQQQEVTGGLLLLPGAEPGSPSLSTTIPFRDRGAPTRAGPAGACPLLCAASSARRPWCVSGSPC
jgi:hypothetical protein